MDKLTFNQMILTSLAGELVDVELGEQSLDHCFDRARKVFRQKGNVNFNERMVAVPVTQENLVYDLSTANVITIVDVLAPNGSLDLSSNDVWTYAYREALFADTRVGAGSSLLTFELHSQLMESIDRYFLQVPEFRYNSISKTLQLLSKPPRSGEWFLRCMVDLTDDEYREVLWVQEYATAVAKTILGRAYGKFNLLPGPGGETSLDGQTLIQEGKEEINQLMIDIDNYTDGDATGSFVIMG